uniref:Uncharacterized protein n=1 Tax=Cacopsylla melanoneura TaxID=428564 RepID=A0A8D9EZX9_9HEMI
MGSSSHVVQHIQVGAEEESAGCVGCAQLVRQFEQRNQGVQVYDDNQNDWRFNRTTAPRPPSTPCPSTTPPSPAASPASPSQLSRLLSLVTLLVATLFDSNADQ